MKRILLIFVLFLSAAAAAAQTAETIVRNADSFLDKWQRKGLDTAYVAVPDEKWSLKTAFKYEWSNIELLQSGFNGNFTSRARLREGFGVSYKGLGFNFNVDLTDKVKDAFAIGFQSYGRKLCLEYVFRSDRSFAGVVTSPSSKVSVMPGSVQHGGSDLDIWYVFNGGRFSFPAAFNQSRLQKRNAGSWLLAFSSKIDLTRLAAIPDMGIPEMDIRGGAIALGGGYGYNIVDGPLLLHVSLIPALVVVDSNVIISDGSREQLRSKFGNMITSANFCAVYNFGRFFAGTLLTLRNRTMGHPEQVDLGYHHVQGNVFVGVRL